MSVEPGSVPRADHNDTPFMGLPANRLGSAEAWLERRVIIRTPIFGEGIIDAFRDAETLANALDNGFSGRQPLENAVIRLL